MEPEIAPLTVYTIREYREDKSLAHEHIFIGTIFDEATLKKINTGRKDPKSDKDIKPIFEQFNVQFTPAKAKTYYPIQLELNDTWAIIIQKIKNISKNSILDFILQSLRKTIEPVNYLWPNQTKLILYYTKFFGNTY